MQYLKDFLPAIGWVVTFLLGILSGGFIIPRLITKKKILFWAVTSHSEIIPKELSSKLGVPVLVKIGVNELNSLHSVTFLVGNEGNETLENLQAKIGFNKNCQIIQARLVEDLGEFGKTIKLSPRSDGTFQLEVTFLNVNQAFEIEFLLSDFEADSAYLDAAAPGLKIKRVFPKNWEFSSSLLRSLEVNMFGIRFTPSIFLLSEIKRELQFLRRDIVNR